MKQKPSLYPLKSANLRKNPVIRLNRVYLTRGVWLILAAILLLSTGCEAPELTQTQAFEYAEEHYRDGQYDAALDGYQAFLKSYPTSPLAATVEMRIRTIHREVRSVMMKKDVPRPRYLGDAKKSATPSDRSPTPNGARHHEDSDFSGEL